MQARRSTWPIWPLWSSQGCLPASRLLYWVSVFLVAETWLLVFWKTVRSPSSIKWSESWFLFYFFGFWIFSCVVVLSYILTQNLEIFMVAFSPRVFSYATSFSIIINTRIIFVRIWLFYWKSWRHEWSNKSTGLKRREK